MRSRLIRTLALFAILLAIGMATRFPALQFPQLYALHGVLAAPFCAAAAYWSLRREDSALPLFLATALLALVLGMMSPVMGMSFGTLAALTVIVWFAFSKARASTRVFATAFLFGTLDYLCVLFSGIAFGSYACGPNALSSIIPMALIGCGLALLGALIASRIFSKRPVLHGWT